jgi:hypothetical protein
VTALTSRRWKHAGSPRMNFVLKCSDRSGDGASEPEW